MLYTVMGMFAMTILYLFFFSWLTSFLLFGQLNHLIFYSSMDV